MAKPQTFLLGKPLRLTSGLRYFSVFWMSLYKQYKLECFYSTIPFNIFDNFFLDDFKNIQTKK